MCAALGVKTAVIRPGRPLRAWRRKGEQGSFVWAGFARRELGDWWRKQGWEPVDVPAERFAERSDRTRQLAWDEVPAGMIVRGVVEANADKPLLKIVTRASTADELARFEHPRMPLIEPPLFSAELLGVEDELQAQRELF